MGSKGEVYGIDYYAGGKKHREIVGPRLGEAQKKLSERKARKGQPLSLVSLKRKTFQDLAEEYEKKFENDPYFQKTRKYYLKTLKEHFGPMRLMDIGILELETYKTERKNTKTKHGKERSGIAVNRELETLNHMFNKALLWGWMEINPFTKFKDQSGKDTFFYPENGRLRYLEEDEMKKLLEALDKKPERESKKRGGGKRKSPEYLKNIINAAILTGMRKTDLLNLKWSDYKRESGRLYFYETKKKKMADKILSDDMIALLESIPRGDSEFIFTNPQGGNPKKPSAVIQNGPGPGRNQRFSVSRSAAYVGELPDNEGASLKSVQQQLGHTTLKMTERYAHLSDHFQREEVNRLNGLLPFPLANSKNLVRSGQKEGLPISEEAANA